MTTEEGELKDDAKAECVIALLYFGTLSVSGDKTAPLIQFVAQVSNSMVAERSVENGQRLRACFALIAAWTWVNCRRCRRTLLTSPGSRTAAIREAPAC